MKIKFKTFSGRARSQIRATAGSSGYDLFSAEKVNRLQKIPNSVQKISTDIGLKILKNLYGRICCHSSYALEFTSVGTGVADSNYCRNLSVVFFNFLNKFYQVEIGDRIAQIVFEKISLHTIEEVYDFDDTTKRGIGAFGSKCTIVSEKLIGTF